MVFPWDFPWRSQDGRLLIVSVLHHRTSKGPQVVSGVDAYWCGRKVTKWILDVEERLKVVLQDEVSMTPRNGLLSGLL